MKRLITSYDFLDMIVETKDVENKFGKEIEVSINFTNGQKKIKIIHNYLMPVSTDEHDPLKGKYLVKYRTYGSKEHMDEVLTKVFINDMRTSIQSFTMEELYMHLNSSFIRYNSQLNTLVKEHGRYPKSLEEDTDEEEMEAEDTNNCTEVSSSEVNEDTLEIDRSTIAGKNVIAFLEVRISKGLIAVHEIRVDIERDNDNVYTLMLTDVRDSRVILYNNVDSLLPVNDDNIKQRIIHPIHIFLNEKYNYVVYDARLVDLKGKSMEIEDVIRTSNEKIKYLLEEKETCHNEESSLQNKESFNSKINMLANMDTDIIAIMRTKDLYDNVSECMFKIKDRRKAMGDHSLEICYKNGDGRIFDESVFRFKNEKGLHYRPLIVEVTEHKVESFLEYPYEHDVVRKSIYDVYGEPIDLGTVIKIFIRKVQILSSKSDDTLHDFDYDFSKDEIKFKPYISETGGENKDREKWIEVDGISTDVFSKAFLQISSKTGYAKDTVAAEFYRHLKLKYKDQGIDIHDGKVRDLDLFNGKVKVRFWYKKV